MSDALPAIRIEGFSVEFPRSFRYRRPARRQRRFIAVVEATRHRYETTVGAYRAFSPRQQPRVEHRVDRPVAEVLRALSLDFDYDAALHEYRAPAQLHVPWSWPPVPVWLGVSACSHRRAVLSVTLRSRRRLRYPRRYYAAAHELLRATRSG